MTSLGAGLTGLHEPERPLQSARYFQIEALTSLHEVGPSYQADRLSLKSSITIKEDLPERRGVWDARMASMPPSPFPFRSMSFINMLITHPKQRVTRLRKSERPWQSA